MERRGVVDQDSHVLRGMTGGVHYHIAGSSTFARGVSVHIRSPPTGVDKELPGRRECEREQLEAISCVD